VDGHGRESDPVVGWFENGLLDRDAPVRNLAQEIQFPRARRKSVCGWLRKLPVSRFTNISMQKRGGAGESTLD